MSERREVLCKKLELIKDIVGEVYGNPRLELELADSAFYVTEFIDEKAPLERSFEINAKGDYRHAYIFLSMLCEILKNKELNRWDIADSIEIGLLKEADIYTTSNYINSPIKSLVNYFKIFEGDIKIRAAYDLINKVLVRF